MWTEYKKEIIAQEKQGKKDFLKTFYQNNKLGSAISTAKDLNSNGDVKLDISFESNSSIRDQSISIVLDSDEEPLPQPQPKENKKVIYNYYDTKNVFGEYNNQHKSNFNFFRSCKTLFMQNIYPSTEC